MFGPEKDGITYNVRKNRRPSTASADAGGPRMLCTLSGVSAAFKEQLKCLKYLTEKISEILQNSLQK